MEGLGSSGWGWEQEVQTVTVAKRGDNMHWGVASQVVQDAEPFAASQDLGDGDLLMQQGQVESGVAHAVPLQHGQSCSIVLHTRSVTLYTCNSKAVCYTTHQQSLVELYKQVSVLKHQSRLEV